MINNEQIITGRKFRVLLDKPGKIWQRFSFWTKAEDVEFDDGETLETKIMNIKNDTIIELNQKYLEIEGTLQTLNNHILELDTRVTNAINGGDLASPFTYNYLIAPFSSSAGSGMPILEDTATRFSVQAHYSNHFGYRTYQPQTVPKKGKLYYSFSASSNVHTATVILVINGTAMASATTPNQLSGVLDLANYVGQNITVQVQLSPDGAGGGFCLYDIK